MTLPNQKKMLSVQDSEKVSEIAMKNDLLTVSQIEKKENLFANEMKTGKISKGRKKQGGTDLEIPKNISKVKTVVKNYNEAGQRLTKKGELDKRAGVLDKESSRYKHIIAMRAKRAPSIPYIEEESSDESDLEFTIETIEPSIEPSIVAPTEILIQKEVEKRKVMDDDMLKLIEENKKLKDSVYFNDHLRKIDSMARNTKMKF